MAYRFTSDEWLEAFANQLNSDAQYAEIAKKWEGDLMFDLRAEPGAGGSRTLYYMDLWHGRCRSARMIDEAVEEVPQPRFILRAPLDQFIRILKSELDPMQAMLTRRLQVSGSMGYMLRNVPVVLDFVRCAREVDTTFDMV